MRSMPNHPVKEFVEELRPTASQYPLDREFTERELFEEIHAERMHGFCQLDVEIPIEKRIE